MKPAIAIGILGLLAAHAASAQTVSDVWAAHTERQKECSANYVAKKIKTATRFMHCAYDGFYDALSAAGAQNLDLFRDLIASEFAIAERIDRKKITFAEGEAEESQAISRIDTEAQTRVQAAAQTQAVQQEQQQQADAAAAQQAQAEAQANLERRRALYCSNAAAMSGGTGLGAELAKSAAPLCARFGYPLPAQQPQATYPEAPITSMPTQTHCQWFGQQWQCSTY
jgi:hypothetical protein